MPPISDPKPEHPGQYIRDEVLKRNKLNITQAAKLLGVSRPALSNVLNAKVSLTPEMATRIEKAFGTAAKALLDMQTAYDSALVKQSGSTISKQYVPPFLNLTANTIEEWASGVVARIRLAVLLRVLVNSTGEKLTRVDFPGNDDAERQGWDGFVEAESGTPWIPAGKSGWEFGTNKDIAKKATDDFTKSVKGVPKNLRAETTFVFVTPRRWAGKRAWTEAHKAKGQWKDVRGYEASDIEQWLEQSVAGQAWLAREIEAPSKGVLTLEACWFEWSSVTTPPMSPGVFAFAMESEAAKIEKYVSKDPERPLAICADSNEEAIAFLSQAFCTESLLKYRDRVLLFTEPGTLPTLLKGAKSYIPIVKRRDTEKELAPYHKTVHSFVIHPHGVVNVEPDIVLRPLKFDAFRKALEGMNFERDPIERLERESGRSLTVLRRRLANLDAIRTPSWASSKDVARSLIAPLMAGAWNAASEYDKIVLARLAKKTDYADVEATVLQQSKIDEAPTWMAGTFCGVVSKIDTLYAIANFVAHSDLDTFFDIAKEVLSEDDPKLDLPEEDQWAAAIHGKSRKASGALRDGISESLVMLAVHGNQLFKTYGAEARVIRLVQELLTPLTVRKLEAHDDDLRTYAEAAPDTLLEIIRNDLKNGESSATRGLIRPVVSTGFGVSPKRTGLLWALEGLAWDPANINDVCLILADLSRIPLDDNWANKPIRSLSSILSSWMPQTAASLEQRIAVLERLNEKFPDITWTILTDQFDGRSRVGHYSHKPKWRNDGYGFGEPKKTFAEITPFAVKALELALGRKTYTPEMLGDLVERVIDISEEDQVKVWDIIKTWSDTASDFDKATVREKIRVTILSRRGVRRAGDNIDVSRRAKEAVAALEPTDLIAKHEWLFRQYWVDESADEIQEDEYDYRKRDARIADLRVTALKDVIAAQGSASVVNVAARGNAASAIGYILVTRIFCEAELLDFVQYVVPEDGDNLATVRKHLISGIMHSIPDKDARIGVLKVIKEPLGHEKFLTVLLNSPFDKSTWDFVDQLAPEKQEKYWRDVVAETYREDHPDLNEAVERLLSAHRPRAAFYMAHLAFKHVRPELLFSVLTAMATDKEQKPDDRVSSGYEVEQAFEVLNKVKTISTDEKAGLEFMYIEVLSEMHGSRKVYGIPNIEKYLEEHPEFFAEVVSWAYKRDDKEDEGQVEGLSDEAKGSRAMRAYRLLRGLRKIPFVDKDGDPTAPANSTLASWIASVREASRKYGRQDITDYCIGEYLSHCPTGSDGIWPCVPVRDAVENVESESMCRGIHVGQINARGAHFRGEGGTQEREIANRYRKWALGLEYTHPFVFKYLLMLTVKSYERHAEREDSEAQVRQRLD